jgi:hypothetical protein
MNYEWAFYIWHGKEKLKQRKEEQEDIAELMKLEETESFKTIFEILDNLAMDAGLYKWMKGRTL